MNLPLTTIAECASIYCNHRPGALCAPNPFKQQTKSIQSKTFNLVNRQGTS